MVPDILFWFYKDFETCRERLQRLRNLNKGVRIFALYGGSLSEAGTAEKSLGNLVDDFYIFPEERDQYWKWENGDQLIASWYEDRGRYLEWETIFVAQWDMLILAPLEKLFHGLQPNEILLSGYTPINAVSSWWPWVNQNKTEFLLFKELLRTKYNYDGEFFACLFITACLPRIFLDKYVAAGRPETGFLEYKIPTMAHMFGIAVCNNHDFNPWWKANPATKNAPMRQRSLNAVGQEVPFSVIVDELTKSNGKRLFHPVFTILPAWMENHYIARLLRHTYLLKVFEIVLGFIKKIK